MEKYELLKDEHLIGNSNVFITVEEMAGMLSIARATAYQLTKISGFPCFYIGKRIIIPTSAFHKWTLEQADNKSTILLNDLD